MKKKEVWPQVLGQSVSTCPSDDVTIDLVIDFSMRYFHFFALRCPSSDRLNCDTVLSSTGGAATPASDVASPRLLSGVAVVVQGPTPTFTRVLEQYENGEQARRRRVAGLFIVS